MAKDTKDRILAAALEMFSRYGYAGTNIRDLTASLGLVKSSMYRHFESKEAIWNALLDEMGMFDIDGDGYRESPSGLPFSFQIWNSAEANDIVPVTELYVEFWSEIGIKAEDFAMMAAKACRDGNINGFKTLSAADVEKIYEMCL